MYNDNLIIESDDLDDNLIKLRNEINELEYQLKSKIQEYDKLLFERMINKFKNSTK